MSNQISNILAGAFFDQINKGYMDCTVGNYFPEILTGSMNNPLQALRLMCMDVVTESSFEPEQLAKVARVPVRWFEAERLDAPAEEALKALGAVALVYLSCLRNEAMRYGHDLDSRENSLEAVETFRAVLDINCKLNEGHKTNKH